jgi:hypothetical protein
MLCRRWNIYFGCSKDDRRSEDKDIEGVYCLKEYNEDGGQEIKEINSLLLTRRK